MGLRVLALCRPRLVLLTRLALAERQSALCHLLEPHLLEVLLLLHLLLEVSLLLGQPL
jgi:hypothetical protein